MIKNQIICTLKFFWCSTVLRMMYKCHHYIKYSCVSLRLWRNCSLQCPHEPLMLELVWKSVSGPQLTPQSHLACSINSTQETARLCSKLRNIIILVHPLVGWMHFFIWFIFFSFVQLSPVKLRNTSFEFHLF